MVTEAVSILEYSSLQTSNNSILLAAEWNKITPQHFNSLSRWWTITTMFQDSTHLRKGVNLHYNSQSGSEHIHLRLGEFPQRGFETIVWKRGFPCIHIGSNQIIAARSESDLSNLKAICPSLGADEGSSQSMFFTEKILSSTKSPQLSALKWTHNMHKN